MIERYITYIRTRHFLGPDLEKRYYRMFGDLEYDLLALRIETEVMSLRVREVRRRATSSVWISAEDERQINVTSHELNEHLYNRLEKLQNHITEAKHFRYDHDREKQAYFLFYDIAVAILGIGDPALRDREKWTLSAARDAYARLDLSDLIDHHDRVQELVALERRETASPDEEQEWDRRLREVEERHPLRYVHVMASPEGIAGHMEKMKTRIKHQEALLERHSIVYAAAVRAMRYRN